MGFLCRNATRWPSLSSSSFEVDWGSIFHHEDDTPSSRPIDVPLQAPHNLLSQHFRVDLFSRDSMLVACMGWGELESVRGSF